MRAALTFVALATAVTAGPLGPYNVDPKQISVGGLSAGAFMAVQYHVAFSSSILGASVFAGGPYYCAQGQETNALTTCMSPVLGGPNAQELADLTSVFADAGSIDPVSNLANSKVFIYSGIIDTVVSRTVVTSLQDYYALFVQSSAGGNITTEYDVLSEHCFPTVSFGSSCTTLGEPYINACEYDGAGASLTTLYGMLKPKTTMVQANLMMFDQTPFGTGNSLNSVGFIYVPTACQKNATCALHTTADISDEYAADIGINEWAESNNIIVLYPQVVKSELFPSNPEGCWDWWGYTNSNYANKQGPQMAFTQALINAITGQ